MVTTTCAAYERTLQNVQAVLDNDVFVHNSKGHTWPVTHLFPEIYQAKAGQALMAPAAAAAVLQTVCHSFCPLPDPAGRSRRW